MSLTRRPGDPGPRPLAEAGEQASGGRRIIDVKRTIRAIENDPLDPTTPAGPIGAIKPVPHPRSLKRNVTVPDASRPTPRIIAP